MTITFATPGDPYLKKIGIMAYAVTSMEWTVLGDLPQHELALPPNCTIDRLAGKTTGELSRRFGEAAAAATDTRVANFLRTAERVLGAAALIRNDVLHARPATEDGEQRLYRWKANITPFVIDDAWLDSKLADLADLAQELSDARVP